MLTSTFLDEIHGLGIDTFVGVPDSTLSTLCARLNELDQNHHMCTVNEGAAVALAAGHYLATAHPACVYMQNSGIGNAINPIASLTHADVYDIPMLFVIGYRGEPGHKDEPQHVFQGKITLPLLEVLDIEHAVLSKATSIDEFTQIMKRANTSIAQNKSFALVVSKGTFEDADTKQYENDYTYVREDAIATLVSSLQEKDVVVSTTGKISRELYEQLDAQKGNHEQAFLTVGSMGHSSMIAYGISQCYPEKKIYCLDGDGAALMHLGSLAFLAQCAPANFVHIVLNNGAHESVGGMPTGATNLTLSTIAESCGYTQVFTATTKEEFVDILNNIKDYQKPCFIEVMVKMQSRDSLGRPKESPIENKTNFMKYNEVKI